MVVGAGAARALLHTHTTQRSARTRRWVRSKGGGRTHAAPNKLPPPAVLAPNSPPPPPCCCCPNNPPPAAAAGAGAGVPNIPPPLDAAGAAPKPPKVGLGAAAAAAPKRPPPAEGVGAGGAPKSDGVDVAGLGAPKRDGVGAAEPKREEEVEADGGCEVVAAPPPNPPNDVEPNIWAGERERATKRARARALSFNSCPLHNGQSLLGYRLQSVALSR